MKLPGFRRIFTTDYQPKEQDFVARLSTNINSAFDSVFAVLNKNVSLADNVACTVKDIEVRVDASGIPTSTTSFRLDTTGTVTMVLVGNVTNVSNPVGYPTSAVQVSWSQVTNGVQINHVTGLNSSDTFRLRVVAFV